MGAKRILSLRFCAKLHFGVDTLARPFQTKNSKNLDFSAAADVRDLFRQLSVPLFSRNRPA